MIKHTFFGKIDKKEYWEGFHSEIPFKIPYFDKEVYIYLGSQFDENWEEIEIPPSDEQLLEYEQTLKSFLENIEQVILDIQQTAFEYYQQFYAHYYEEEFEVLFKNNLIKLPENQALHQPLGITTKEKHFEYMKDILEAIRILDHQTIIIPIRYALDHEHGLEMKIINNKVVQIGGIADTY